MTGWEVPSSACYITWHTVVPLTHEYGVAKGLTIYVADAKSGVAWGKGLLRICPAHSYLAVPSASEQINRRLACLELRSSCHQSEGLYCPQASELRRCSVCLSPGYQGRDIKAVPCFCNLQTGWGTCHRSVLHAWRSYFLSLGLNFSG